MSLTVPLLHQIPVVRSFPSLTLCMILATGSASASPAAGHTYTQANDTIVVQKTVTSKKYKVKLYPNASHEVLYFNASGQEGKVYQLFLFDLEGKLVKQANIRDKETTMVNKIEKGNYLFEVFSDDERIENGQVIIR